MKSADDAFGQRMKAYESIETCRYFDPSLPVYARIDGRAFHTFTRGLEKPFDLVIAKAMSITTAVLVEKTHAKIGFCQSDEINLVYEGPYNIGADSYSPIIFDGCVHKLTSVLASLAASVFIHNIPRHLAERYPHFDCRVCQMPSRDETANMMLWRAMDAKKNGISAIAHANFSHKELQGKRQADMREMLLQKVPTFEHDYSIGLREGIWFRREKYLANPNNVIGIPEHMPSGDVWRSHIVRFELPTFNKVKNRVGVIFEGEEPRVE